MNWDRFQPPGREPRDLEREEEIENEKADAWHDQAVDREREDAEEKQDNP